MDFSLTQKQLDVQRAVKEFAERELNHLLLKMMKIVHYQ